MSKPPNFSEIKRHVFDFGQKTNCIKMTLMANFMRHLEWCSQRFDKDFIFILFSLDQMSKSIS
jgi:hypothetical protein